MQAPTPEFPFPVNPAYFVILPLFALVFVAFGVWMNWRIATKAGYAGVASLLVLIPLVNFGVLIYFAFAEWPIETEVRALRNAKSPY